MYYMAIDGFGRWLLSEGTTDKAVAVQAVAEWNEYYKGWCEENGKAVDQDALGSVLEMHAKDSL